MRAVSICGFLLVATVMAATAQEAEEKQDSKSTLDFVWHDYPSIRAGAIVVDAHTKWQADVRGSDQDLADVGDTYQTNLKRVGIAGQIGRRIHFELEREIRRLDPWRNVYVNLAIAPALEIRAGKFKMPFSYDELTSVTRLDFAYRSELARVIAPGRDVGVMVHGRILRQLLAYQGGMFRHDGETSRFSAAEGTPSRKSNRSIVARVSIQPLHSATLRRDVRNLFLGLAATSSAVPDGLNGLHERNVFGSTIIDPVSVSGHRRRIGSEAVWMPGPISMKAEYARSSDQRKRQGSLGNDLPDVVASAWYVSGTWLITGEHKESGGEPRKPLPRTGFGAVEVGARYESMAFRPSHVIAGTPNNDVVDPLRQNSEGVLTLGVNWYLNKWAKFVANVIRESFAYDRTVILRKSPSWSGVLRLQFVM